MRRDIDINALVEVLRRPESFVAKEGYSEHATALSRLLSHASDALTECDVVHAHAAQCHEFIRAGAPCVRDTVVDQAIVDFISVPWQAEYDSVCTELFDAYIRHGYIRLDEPIRSAKTGMYARLDAKLPVVAAAHRGSMHIACALIEHGARTDVLVDGEDFFVWARTNVGCDVNQRENAWRDAAWALLIEATMRKSIGTPPEPMQAPARRPRVI